MFQVCQLTIRTIELRSAFVQGLPTLSPSSSKVFSCSLSLDRSQHTLRNTQGANVCCVVKQLAACHAGCIVINTAVVFGAWLETAYLTSLFGVQAEGDPLTPLPSLHDFGGAFVIRLGIISSLQLSI